GTRSDTRREKTTLPVVKSHNCTPVRSFVGTKRLLGWKHTCETHGLVLRWAAVFPVLASQTRTLSGTNRSRLAISGFSLFPALPTTKAPSREKATGRPGLERGFPLRRTISAPESTSISEPFDTSVRPSGAKSLETAWAPSTRYSRSIWPVFKSQRVRL